MMGKQVNDRQVEPMTQRLWPETGKALGLGRVATYEAAKRGEIPTIRIGKLLLVPIRALEKMLDI
jgi:hypothetical protein